MKIKMRSIVLPTVFFLVIFVAGASAQGRQRISTGGGRSAGASIAAGTATVGVVIVKSAGKLAWGTTKILAADVAFPVTRLILAEAVPSVVGLAVRPCKPLVRLALPIAVKLSIL